MLNERSRVCAEVREFGGLHFSRQIPGDYTLNVRLGEAIQTATVRVAATIHVVGKGSTLEMPSHVRKEEEAGLGSGKGFAV